MKMIVAVVLALVAVAAAIPVEKVVAEIKEYENNQNAEGYKYLFSSNDGISRKEEGTLKDATDEDNKPVKVLTVRGSYSYPREGEPDEVVTYFADETGFHAEGLSIPRVLV